MCSIIHSTVHLVISQSAIFDSFGVVMLISRIFYLLLPLLLFVLSAFHYYQLNTH
jgi:hypothetical protein